MICLAVNFFAFDIYYPSNAFAGPGAGFVKMDLLPETSDPYDLYFNFTFIRFMRPGEPPEVPRSHFITLNEAGLKSPDKNVKQLKIVMEKKDGGSWYSFFDMFYYRKTVICDYDRSQNLVKAVMLDESGEVCLQNVNSFDASGRLIFETAEVFDSVFGHDGSGSVSDNMPRTRKLIISKSTVHTYSAKGILTRSDFKAINSSPYSDSSTLKTGYFEYIYDAADKLVKLSCYEKDEKKPFYIFEYTYNEKGKLSGIKWFNGLKDELEMYYDYVYDSKENCVTVKCPVHLLAVGREDAKLENTFKYDDSNRLTDVVYYNWLKREDPKPDSLIHFSYDEKTRLLSEIEMEPAKMNAGKKYSLKYSYEFF